MEQNKLYKSEQKAYRLYSRAPLAELVDARDSKSRSFGSAGSIPAGGTIFLFHTVQIHPKNQQK